MFDNLCFHLFYCNLTENCKVYHKAYLLLNSDRVILTVFQRGQKSLNVFNKAAKKKKRKATTRQMA